MRKIYLSLFLLLAACATTRGTIAKIEKQRLTEAQENFNAPIPEGNFRSRHKAIHALPGEQLCEAVLPINKLDWFFIPMTEPVGVVRWKKQYFTSSQIGEHTGNVKIGINRLFDELENELRKCFIKAGMPYIVADKPYLDQPWDDVTCSASAVRKICGNDFVSEENYDQLMLTPQERRPYREALRDARVDAIWRSSQINCSGYTIGNTTRTTCR